MRHKKSSKKILFITVPLGFILFASLFVLNFAPKSRTQDRSTQNRLASLIENITTLSAPLNQEQMNVDLPASRELQRGEPAHLKIPNLDVDAPFEYVGLTSGGAMDIPKEPSDVAWFNLGPRPGEVGSAVIAGHYGWKNNTPAVFDNLHKLRKGDKVSVEDKNGIITTFVVRKMETYGKDDIAPEVFNSNDGKAHLNLVTCTGVWNKTRKTYSERLVVFTDKL